MGISTVMAGKLSFPWRRLIGALSGVLIAPITTIYYDTGFLIGLKGFVGAIIGGLASYPLAAPAPCWSACSNPFLVLGQRLQGGDRVHPDHPGAGLALADHATTWRRRNEVAAQSSPVFRPRRLLVLAPLVLFRSSTSPCSTTSACIPSSPSAWCCSPASAA
jgi:hypothetical protein